MKISELIEVLQKAKEIHGDIYIGNQDDIITKELKEYKSIPYGAVTHSYFALTESDKSTNYKTQKFYDNPKKAIIYSIGKKEYLKNPSKYHIICLGVTNYYNDNPFVDY